MTKAELLALTPEELRAMPRDEFKLVTAKLLDLREEHKRANAISYYEMVNPGSLAIHQSTARTTGVGGGNGCVALSEPVLMADGTWKPLGKIEVGEFVMGADPVTGITNPTRVSRTYRSGVRAIYRTTFSDGGWFEATLDHKVPLYLGSGRKTTKGNPKLPHKRVLRDYHDAINARGSKNPSKRISAVSPGYVTPQHPDGKPEVRMPAYLLGALLGDGSTTQRTTKFHNIDKAVIERVRGHVEDMGLNFRKYTHGCEYGISGPSTLYDELVRLGVQGKRDRLKRIPKECFFQGHTFRRELAAGLIDTDGTRDWFTSASKGLAEDFAKLIRWMGGKATIHQRATDSTFGKAWSVYWRMNERLPLSRPDKQAVNQRGREIDYRRRICRTIEFVRYDHCGDIEVEAESHCYITGDNVIVSNSSKTETCIVEMVACATGICPESLKDKIDFKKKFRGPINCRIICESLTTVLHPVILPKLRWSSWTGVDAPGGKRGHWGWIPKHCLIDESWEKSWSEKLRTLRFWCYDPDDPTKRVGQSTIQCMSHEQDPSDFASGDFHMVLFDEPPKYTIFVENQARTMRVNGRMMLAMTWPDDPAINVDWLFDEVYDPAQPGPNKDPNIDWFNLFTTDNQSLDQTAVAAQADNWSDEVKSVRVFGQPIRFSNRIHPLFTHNTQLWCFNCKKVVAAMDGGGCRCGADDTIQFNHVEEFEHSSSMPTVFLLDPHPRKPHMFLWVQIDGNDDWSVIADGEVEGDPAAVAAYADRIETNLGIWTVKRMIDPNMGLSPSSSKRGVTWRDEFDSAGLYCDLSDDSDVGRARINELLAPDPDTRRPRLRFHARCENTIYQMSRYIWDDYKKGIDKSQKQKAKDRNDDYPTLLKYLANEDPTFHGLSYVPNAHRVQSGGSAPWAQTVHSSRRYSRS